MHATGHRWKACQHTVTGPVTAMSTAFALEARRPVVVPGRRTYWRLFPSGAKRNEGTAIRLPSRSEVLCPTPGASQSKRMNPLNLRLPDHTQARTAPRRMSPQKGTRVSRPPRKLLEFSMKEHVAGSGVQTFGVRLFFTRRRYLYVIVKKADRDAGGPFTTDVS